MYTFIYKLGPLCGLLGCNNGVTGTLYESDTLPRSDTLSRSDILLSFSRCQTNSHPEVSEGCRGPAIYTVKKILITKSFQVQQSSC
jgi:hypothetical protein